ncbi:MAG TPA: MOSC domain-containing protein [Gemmatimonadales bacterium]
MRVIGPILRLQVQRSTLKTGEKPNRTYDPRPLLPVRALAVHPDGACGASGGAWVVDVHHRAHPATKNEDGLHGLSLGFTSHYAEMRQRFGPHVAVGVAGENIIVDTDRHVTWDEMAPGCVVLDAAGRELVRLRVLKPAQPCRPFTGWALGGQVEAAVMKEHLQFLDDGMRGYYALAEGSAVLEEGMVLALL